MAVISIQRAIDEGWTASWRLRFDPILQAMHGEEDLKAVIAGLETRLSLMREQLAREIRA